MRTGSGDTGGHLERISTATFALIEELLRRLPPSANVMSTLFDVLTLMQRMEAPMLALVILSVVGQPRAGWRTWSRVTLSFDREGHRRLSTRAGGWMCLAGRVQPGARADLDLQVMPTPMECTRRSASPVRST